MCDMSFVHNRVADINKYINKYKNIYIFRNKTKQKKGEKKERKLFQTIITIIHIWKHKCIPKHYFFFF